MFPRFRPARFPVGWRVALLLLSCIAGLAPAAHADNEDSFSACVASLQHKALDRGISSRVVRQDLGNASQSQRVIELDRTQPEFTTTFADYFNHRVTQERVDRGRKLLKEHHDLLQHVYRQYGVPPRYLVAFWGLETHYGAFFGGVRVLDSLTTLACDNRRSDYFTGQLMDALEIIDEGSITSDRMLGSWAGAMGHVQFMPSVFRKYAVDEDGDGRRDLWGSLPDAMASAGNFLDHLGWKTGWRWGREVQLPKDFPYAKAGLDQPRPLSQWKKLGVRDAYGRPLHAADIEASLLVPSGHRGPAFLVYHNFNVIMGWNQSEFYALAVGRLADRLAGAAPLRNPPPDNAPRLSRDQVITLQKRLKSRGFDAGPTDGIPGPQTREAIRAFQQAHGMVADGFASRAVLAKLDLDVETGQ